MKYCPYCGADLIDSTASFCTECGKTMPAIAERRQATPEPMIYKKERTVKPETKRKKGKKKRMQQTKSTLQREQMKKESIDDGYDGYYDDVLPSDLGKLKEGVDKELIRKIIAVAGVMLLIVGLCVLAMYLL